MYHRNILCSSVMSKVLNILLMVYVFICAVECYSLFVLTGTWFLPASTALGAGLYSISMYGGLALFGMFLLYDTQKIIKRVETHPAPYYGVTPFDPVNAWVYWDHICVYVWEREQIWLIYLRGYFYLFEKQWICSNYQTGLSCCVFGSVWWWLPTITPKVLTSSVYNIIFLLPHSSHLYYIFYNDQLIIYFQVCWYLHGHHQYFYPHCNDVGWWRKSTEVEKSWWLYLCFYTTTNHSL